MKKLKKYLILQLQQVCYGSYTYFTDQIERLLRARGDEVVIFSAAEQPPERLGQLAGAHFDAVIGCNCGAPRITTEEGGYFLDEIDAPFFNLLLDHPLYHHDSLKCRLKNYHVRCLDENHAAYVAAYYPHIKSTGLWAATGSPGTAHVLPICEREIPVLFSGTYTDPDEIGSAIRQLPSFIRADLRLLIEELLTHPQKTIEGAIFDLGDALDSYLPESMPLFVQSCFLADTYVRAFRRRALVLAADQARLPLHLFGADWDKLRLPAGSTVTVHPAVPFTESFSLMAHSRITLNLMPEFKAGFHDRVFSALLNGSVAATDPSRLLLQEFTDEAELVFYDVSELPAACERLRLLLGQPEKLRHIADAGLAAGARYTWPALSRGLWGIP